MGCSQSVNIANVEEVFWWGGRHLDQTGDQNCYHYASIVKSFSDGAQSVAPFIGGAIYYHHEGEEIDPNKLIAQWGITDHRCYVIVPKYVGKRDGKDMIGTYVMYTGEPRDGSSDVVPDYLQNAPVIIGAKYEDKRDSGQTTSVPPRQNWGFRKDVTTFQVHQKAYNHQVQGNGYMTVTFYIGVKPTPETPCLVAKCWNRLMDPPSSNVLALSEIRSPETM
jgi:hypothetical protein